jgi:hypothetical protein
MKKIVFLMLVVFTFFVAYSTKPDDKTCIIEGVKSVWGNRVPDVSRPQYYEQFMELTSKSVIIDDWVFLKRIQYKFTTGPSTIAVGAFKKVFTVKRINNN